MRPTRIAALLALTLLVAAAPFALAAGDAHAEKGKARAEEARAEHAARADDNETADDDAGRPDHAGKGKPEDAPKGPLAALHASLQALREALRLDMAGVRETCHAAEPDHANATKEERLGWAHCIRDGYHKLFDAFRLERAGLREQMRAVHA